MPRKAAKKDSNHNRLSSLAKRLGCKIYDTSRMGDGFPDAVLIYPNGRCQLIEFKTQEHWDLKPAEVTFMVRNADPTYRIIFNEEEMLRLYEEEMGSGK